MWTIQEFIKLLDFVSSQQNTKPMLISPISASPTNPRLNQVLKIPIWYNPNSSEEYRYAIYFDLSSYRFKNMKPLKKYSSIKEFPKVI